MTNEILIEKIRLFIGWITTWQSDEDILFYLNLILMLFKLITMRGETGISWQIIK